MSCDKLDIPDDASSDKGDVKPIRMSSSGRLRAPRWKEIKEMIESGLMRREPVAGEVSSYIDRIFDAESNQPLYFFCKLCNRVFVHNNSSSSNRRHLRETHGLKISRAFADSVANESIPFVINDSDGHEENDMPLSEWATQTTSGEMLNRFLHEAEQQQSKNNSSPAEADQSMKSLSPELNIIPPTLPIIRSKPVPSSSSNSKTLCVKPMIAKPRTSRLQQLRERLLRARARKENALALKALAEANRIKMETMIAVHRAGFIRTSDRAGLRPLTEAEEGVVIKDNDYDFILDEGDYAFNVADFS